MIYFEVEFAVFQNWGAKMKSRIPTLFRWGAIALMVGTLGACGSSNDSTPTAPVVPVVPAAPAAIVTPPTAEAVAAAAVASSETCSLCHAGSTPLARSGPGHQADFDQLYQNGVYKITAINYSFASPTSTLSFTMTKNGAPFDCTTLKAGAGTTADPGSSLGSYWAAYDAATNTFSSAVTPAYLSLAGTKAYLGAGVCTMTKTFTAAADIAAAASIATSDGIIQVYGADEILEKNSAKHMSKARYPFAGLLRLGATMGAPVAPFASAANVSGCENCHTVPFNKHAYIPGTVDDVTPGAAAGTTQQFYVCKGCHSDARTGGHAFWQLLKEAKDADPATPEGAALRARAVAVNGGEALTAAEKTKYAYKAKLMNDVHMSHAMEFAYPQSMRNCVTCHAGKLGETAGNIFLAANFKAETCISCHGVEGITAKMKAASYNHSSFVTDEATLRAATCSVCHDGSAAPKFSKVHNGGYDWKIYTDTGVRFSTSLLVSIDSATLDASTNVLDVKFSASGTAGGYSATDIVPTVVVGLYGYNTKDFIVQAHGSDADGNRLLEYKFGGTNPRFTEVATAAAGSWEVKVDLSAWKDMIADGTIKRAEIAVLPEVGHKTKTEVARGGAVVPVPLGLDAPSKTFDLAANAFDPTFTTGDIINVQTVGQGGGTATKGCNTCHDQLATTFHSGIRGGNVKVCRLCHTKSNAGGHLELQSRSIDSYVHAIHSFQIFDIGDIDFADTFEAMEYTHHTETYFPRFGLGNGATDCESCHKAGMYGTPDQSKSLPGLLSATDTLKGKTRNIGAFPSYVTGPGATACGGCHRAQKIVEDDAGGLTTIFQHWKGQGYLIENVATLWDATVAKVMATFK
jgi:OmcA/MtrC family decaheme c-type cytochrome